ncbi:MAG: hypothetical protein ACRDRP_10255 [Pseudonocardiaceae bacterium]
MADKKGKNRLWIIVGAAAVIGLILLSSRPESGTDGQCLVRVTADRAPVRSGPDADDSVGALPAGLVIQAERTTSNGFRQLQPDRWVAEQHVNQVPGSNCS